MEEVTAIYTSTMESIRQCRISCDIIDGKIPPNTEKYYRENEFLKSFFKNCGIVG